MTSQQPPHEGKGGKAEAVEGAEIGTSPMERFRSLTRTIIGVTRAQVREQERRNEHGKATKEKTAS
jgi:hypothetical protein